MFFFLFSACYFLLIFIYFIAFFTKHNDYLKSKNYSTIIPISIIIPIRNEENNIIPLLNSLLNQNYPNQFYEIIIVDDHSTDNSLKKIHEFCGRAMNHIRIYSLNENEHGKKSAILKGIQQASFDIIATTDADCIFQSDWLLSVAALLNYFKPDLIIGPVFVNETTTFIKRMLSIEQLSLVATTAASALLNNPIMCSGANLVIKKESYLNVVNHLKYFHPSGDDMFLLQVFKKTRKKIIFNSDPAAAVYTKPVLTLKEFIEQRQRWVSKSKYYDDVSIIFIALLVAITNFSIVITLFMTLVNIMAWKIYIMLMLIKCLADLPLLYITGRHYHQPFSFISFIVTQFIYPMYVTFIAIYGNFGRFSWKNREINE